MTSRARRRSFVDHFLLAPNPPALVHPNTPEPLRPHISLRERLRQALDDAFPLVNASSRERPSITTFQNNVNALAIALNALVSRLERLETVGAQYAQHCAEAQIPSLMVDVLARSMRYRTIGSPATNTNIKRETLPDDPSSVMRHPAAIQIVDTSIVALLRTMNVLSASSELLSSRLAADRRLLPLLFESMRCGEAVEMALALIEEMLHAPRRPPDFDLSTLPALPELVDSLTPFQLGSFCRVLAPLVDERDVPMCGGDHCTGNCTLSSAVTNHDWQQIEPAANQLKARRSYVGAAERVLRDRNHAVLLAIPGLLKKLVKLIAVPPAPRNELILVDHALRSGVFTFNYDLADVMGDSPHPVTLHAALIATVRGEGGADGEIVIEHIGGGAQQQPQGQNNQQAQEQPAHQQGQTAQGQDREPRESSGNGLSVEDEMRQRVLLMVFRRLTGMDNDDADQAGTDKWDVLEKRVDRAAVDHAMGHGFENGVFRERRRRGPQHGLGPGLRISTGDAQGVMSVEAVATQQQTNEPIAGNPPGAPSGENRSGAASANSQATTPRGRARRSRRAASPHDDDDDDDAASPHMSINGLLMSSHQVEVMFVLYSLLIGRRKSEVQAALADAGIFPVLERFCDALDWKDSSRETKTEESLKVHFIRLLHYMCDGLGANFPADRLEWLFAEHERTLLESIEEGKIQDLSVAQPSSIWQVPTSTRDPALLGLQNLSITSPSSSNCATPSNSIQSEVDSTGRHFQCSPIRSDNLTHVLDEDSSAETRKPNDLHANGYHSPQPKAPPPKTPVEELSPCLTPKSSIFAHNRPGIICKVARILANTDSGEENESARRYLVSGCIETFLRTASTSEKTLIAQQGLLRHLVEQLSESTNKIVQISQFRQTSFDLLGQLVKWNRGLFRYMNEIFQSDRKLLTSLLKAVSDRLVDSNVFVRSIVISLERFRAEDELNKAQGNTSHTKYDFENCLLWEFIETFRVRLVYDLLCSVRVEDVNFENICCVNTTLILLVVSCRTEGSLDELLTKVVDIAIETIVSGAERPQSLFGVNPINIFENFRKLVEFWKSYYRYQGLDVASQEIGSNIHFHRLVEAADLLLKRLPRLHGDVRKEAARIPCTEPDTRTEECCVTAG